MSCLNWKGLRNVAKGSIDCVHRAGRCVLGRCGVRGVEMSAAQETAVVLRKIAKEIREAVEGGDMDGVAHAALRLDARAEMIERDVV